MKITTLKTIAPFTAKELGLLEQAINMFSTGGHPAPNKQNINGFNKTWVRSLLKKLEKSPVVKDLQTVRYLIDRCTK